MRHMIRLIMFVCINLIRVKKNFQTHVGTQRKMLIQVAVALKK